MSDLLTTRATAELMAPNRVRLRIHGRQSTTNADAPVEADVFARKLRNLVQGLRAADRASNGKLTHNYIIIDLAMGSAIAVLQAMPLPAYTTGDLTSRSSVLAFGDCVTAISEGRTEEARRYGKCPDAVSRLAKGAEDQFGYAELWVPEHRLIRVDEFLTEQAEAVVKPPSAHATFAGRQWFKGVSIGGFDGVVKRVDLRGALPQVKLMLTAGGKELDCICRDVPIEHIRESLDRRVRVRGRVFYDGQTGFPRRVEVAAIEPVKEAGDFTRWRGAFEPFEAADWEGVG